MNISYDWYKIFCCAAECGNITAAAEKLFISQPAVSQTIKQLEETFGCALFARTPKGVRLTAEGRVLQGYLSEGIALFSEGERRLTAMLRLDAGEIKIGASDMTLEFCLLPYLERFHAEYPNIKTAITNNPTPQTLELLKQGKLDFAAVSEPFNIPDFEVIKVREIRDVFICGGKRDIPDNIDISDIQDELIMLEANTSTRTFIDNELKKQGVCVTPRFELATSPQIVRFTARNMGIGCVVSDFAEQAVFSGEVKIINVNVSFPARHICIVCNNDIRSLAADKLFGMITKRC